MQPVCSFQADGLLPPPLRGRGGEGGGCESRSLRLPPSLTLPLKGEGTDRVRRTNFVRHPRRRLAHDPPAQPRHHGQSAHLADPRRHGEARRASTSCRPCCIPSELFWRQLRFAEFDVSEMSISSLMMAKSQGRRPLRRHPDVHHAQVLPHRRSSCAATPASTSPPTSRASASACRNISRPRRCGRAACCSTNSASSPRTWNSGWSACRRTAMAARPASSRRPASPSTRSRSRRASAR